MTNLKKILCLVLACALLLSFGCKKKDESQTPDLPATPEASDTTVQTPPAEPAPQEPQAQEPVREINTQPVLLPDAVTAEPALSREELAARQAAFNSYQEVGYFLEWQLGDEYQIIEVLPGEKDGEYQLWGMHFKQSGLREPFRMLVHVTPDGKDFNLLRKQMLDVTEEWKAVQNYRWLVSALGQGPRPLLESLGFSPVITDNLTSVSYDVFEAVMQSIMTPELYEAHWADYFWEQDGKLAIHQDFGGSEDRYLVNAVQVQEDGTVLSHEFLHDFADEFSTYTVQVELEALPNGAYRVSAWNADNAAIMTQAQSPAPQN